ncbi:hypothetical protein AB0K15_22930 [Amycolatopsis sp. NPDC049253]|uniref:hypothetical protein n=1 Tax=Amycolatopsis sp. NPDC049253 TaxID=3155274 RepID=UPI00342D17B0
MRRYSLAAVLVALTVSGCSAAPPPAPAPSKPAAPTLSPAEELAWHWVGAFCSGLRDSRSELGNLGAHTVHTEGDLAERQRDQQTAAELTASMVRIVHDNAAKVAAAPASPARDRLSAPYRKLEAALTEARRHVDQLPATDRSTFGDAVEAISAEVEAALQTARGTLAEDPATKRFMAQAGTCLLS